MARPGLSSSVRVLCDADLPDLLELLAHDSAANVMVSGRVNRGGMHAGRIGGELWGWFIGNRLTSALFAGANYMPVQATQESLPAFAQLARERGHRPASLVGPAEAILGLWRLLEQRWGPAREVRRCQPLMTLDAPPHIPGEPEVRLAAHGDLNALLPAAIAMFTEEVGISPLGSDGGAGYRASVDDLVAQNRAYVFTEGGRVVFKADVGAVSARACLIQGVWVRPDRRGEGLSVRCMASVALHARTHQAPLVTLYVNDYNLPARRTYQRVGFQDVGTFATVLL